MPVRSHLRTLAPFVIVAAFSFVGGAAMMHQADGDAYSFVDWMRDIIRTPKRRPPSSNVVFPIRYYQQEANGDLHEVTEPREFAVGETALVLVDCFANAPEPMKVIMRERIAPALDAARRAGITIIHSPSAMAVDEYPQWRTYSSAVDRRHVGHTEPSLLLALRYLNATSAWPSRDVRERAGDLANQRRFISAEAEARIAQKRGEKAGYRIYDPLRPQPGDFVVGSGPQLQRVLKSRRIVHLIYAGFATNQCLKFQSYGMVRFLDRGYDVILLDDATMAIELPETRDSLLLTRTAITNFQLNFGSTSTTGELIAACRAIGRGRSS
jgi:nicotinamidase-related amidase